MCRHAVAKVRLLFESSFFSRAAVIQDFTVHVFQELIISQPLLTVPGRTPHAQCTVLYAYTVQVKFMHLIIHVLLYYMRILYK